MPQCLPSCGENPWAAELPVTNTKPRRCLHGTQSTSVGTQLRYITRNLAKQRPPAFHCTWDPIVRRQLWEEGNETNILETTLPHSDDLELGSSARLTPCLSTHMWCVCVYIYIFIYFYCILRSLKYCTDDPMVIVNYRNMKLILNKGSRVPDSKRYVFTQFKNTTGSTPFNFTLCIQCVEYIHRKRVYKGMMTTHQKNHLHIFEISPARVYTT